MILNKDFKLWASTKCYWSQMWVRWKPRWDCIKYIVGGFCSSVWTFQVSRVWSRLVKINDDFIAGRLTLGMHECNEMTESVVRFIASSEFKWIKAQLKSLMDLNYNVGRYNYSLKPAAGVCLDVSVAVQCELSRAGLEGDTCRVSRVA